MVLMLACFLLAEASQGALSGGEPEVIVVAIEINGLPRGDVLVLRAEPDLFALETDLLHAGVRAPAGTRSLISDGARYLSLSALGKFELDELHAGLRVTLPAELFEGTKQDLSAKHRMPELSEAESVALNYAVTVGSPASVDASSEAALRLGAFLLTSEVSASDQAFRRGLTLASYEWPESLLFAGFGERTATSGSLGGAAVVAGLHLVRDRGFAPARSFLPSFGLAGVAPRASTLDVYVNEERVLRRAIPPGPFELDNLPSVNSGAVDVRYVLTDPFGAVSEMHESFYQGGRVLAPGHSDFEYSIGARREYAPDPNWSWSEPIFIGRHTLGLTRALSAGARLEGTTDLVSGGLVIVLQAPLLGSVEVEGAASAEFGGKSGFAGSVAWSYARRFGLSALFRWVSDDYSTVSLAADGERPKWHARLGAGLPLFGSLSLQASVESTDYETRGRVDRLSGQLNALVGSWLTMSASAIAAREDEQPPATGVFFRVGVHGDSMSGSIGVNADSDEAVAVAAFSRPAPQVGFGFGASGSAGRDLRSAGANVQANGQYGVYRGQYFHSASSDSGSVSTAGSLVFAGGRVAAAPPVESFGLVEAGLPGIRVYRGGELGRTDERGVLVIPRLEPYSANQIRIAPEDVPFDHTVGDVSQISAPRRHGGAVTRFDIHPLRLIRGRVTDGAPLDGGDLMDEHGRTTPIAPDGEFELEGLPPGRTTLRAVRGDFECLVTLDVPQQVESDVGTVHCERVSP